MAVKWRDQERPKALQNTGIYFIVIAFVVEVVIMIVGFFALWKGLYQAIKLKREKRRLEKEGKVVLGDDILIKNVFYKYHVVESSYPVVTVTLKKIQEEYLEEEPNAIKNRKRDSIMINGLDLGDLK